jgi:hypothetical protein
MTFVWIFYCPTRRHVHGDAQAIDYGAETPPPTSAEERERIAVLQATVEHYLPDFAKGVNATANGAAMILHQDAFAAGYDGDEHILLGMAIKYAGLQSPTSITTRGSDFPAPLRAGRVEYTRLRRSSRRSGRFSPIAACRTTTCRTMKPCRGHPTYRAVASNPN